MNERHPTDSAQPVVCARCAHPNRTGAKFCDECGAPLAAAREDRRQAVVVFTDISGYTTICARSDAEQVQRMLARFYAAMDEVVEAYGGRVFDRAGDAVMAVFGAPIAHGNDAERALRAAFEMHAGAAAVSDCDGKPLRLHIGIASGEVVASVLGAGGQSKLSVTGDTVNLAARLDALAGAGETLLSPALYRSVASFVEAVALGTHALKGLSEPVSVWRALGLRAAPAESAPLVGRDAELAQLVGALHEAGERHLGLCIAVRGDAGIGKSRLVDELRVRAAALGFGTPAGHVLDFGIGRGQDAVASILRGVLALPATSDAGAQRAGLAQALQAGAIRSDEALFVNALLDLPQPAALQALFDAMDNTTRTQRSCDTLAAVLQRAAQGRPMLVTVEDLHWASAAMLRHAAAIASVAACAPLVLVLTTRIDGDPLTPAWRDTAGAARWHDIALGPLPPDDAHRLARGLVEGEGRFVAQCVARAEGNPLFLEQLLSAQHAAARGGVPPTIQSVVLERVDRLPAAERLKLQAASVIGKRFTPESLRAILDDAAADCESLLAADLVRRDGQGLLFAHALIQEAIYASTLKSVRRDLHRRCAHWFGDAEPVLRAEHLDRADDPTATDAHLAAARAEATQFRFDNALRLAQRGAQLAAASANADVGCRLALLRGEVLRDVGRSADSLVEFTAATELAHDDLQRCQAWMGVAAGHRITGAFDAALQALANAQPLAETLGRDVECSQIHHTRGNLLFAQGKVDACEAEHRHALAYAQRSGDVDCEAQALSGLGDAQYARGRMRSALSYFERCVALCQGGERVRIAVPNRCMTGHCLWYLNRLGEAIDAARRACADAQAIGAVPVQIFAQTSLTQFLAEAGRSEPALLACEHGLALARQAGSRRYESTLLFWRAELSLADGRRQQARDDLDLALQLARQSGIGFLGAALFGRIARAADAPAARREALREGEALLLQPGLAHGHFWFYRDAIEASIANDAWDDALRYAAALEAFTRDEPLPWANAIASRCHALHALASGAVGAAAVAQLRRVRDELESAGLGWALPAVERALASRAA